MQPISHYRKGRILDHRYKCNFGTDEETLAAYAKIADQWKSSEKPIPQNDMWTAALALQTNLPVLTRDRHFDFIEDIERMEW